ncbi:unnamed protein product [Cercopithifilaria johnstoni]|uniref:Chromo domain-containing protein n=1 Tax=Cercopithifilaria johnstoni TaxID=2874296 RepID=A0A8J2M3A8_9BILA|nr:unnamed protein product [Cercopithifilaria johnstoni]
MTQVKNEDDDNDLRLTDQTTFVPDNLLDELLEPDRVVEAEYFLEACSSEEGGITHNTNVVVGNGCESVDVNEERSDNTKQYGLEISDVSKKTETISRIVNKREKVRLYCLDFWSAKSKQAYDSKEGKLQNIGDGSSKKKEEMAVDNVEKNGTSENSDTVGEGNDDEIDDKDGESEDEYVVEKILDKRYNRRKKRIEYLIKWAGYDNESENTWESAENCKSAPDAIREYEDSLKKNTKKYLLRNRPITEESVSNDDEEKPPKALKRKTNEIKEEPYSEESIDDDSEEIQSKRTKIDCILGVKKEGNEVLAVVRFEDGHHDLISTRILVSKCPKVIFINILNTAFTRIRS